MRTKTLTIILTLTVATLSSCSNEEKTGDNAFPAKQDTAKKPRTGDVRDAHGCLTSGGYVWSAAKDSCIRLWESGSVLEPTDRSELVVYAVEAADRMKAEIFIPDDSTVLLQGDGQGSYKNDSLTLSSAGGKYVLQKGGAVIYRTGVPEESAAPERKRTRKKRR